MNNWKFTTIGKGDMVIEVPNGIDASKLQLTKVLYSPEVGYTLVLIGHLDQCGYTTTFSSGTCIIQDDNGEAIGWILRSEKGDYKVIHENDELANVATETLTWTELHCWMGHISPGVAKKLAENGLVAGIHVDMSLGEPIFCESCVYVKAMHKPVPKECEGDQAMEFGEEIHSDLWGPTPVTTLHGHHYYVSFTDDKTQLTCLHLLKHKSDTLEAYKDFEASCKTQHKANVKVLHSDCGGEYTRKEFVMHLKQNGMKQKLTVHDTPQHNDIVEHLNCTILERICTMLHASGQPKFLWGEAVHCAVWLKICTPTKALGGLTPFEVVYGWKPDLCGLHDWGSCVWVQNKSKSKLDGCVNEGVWVGLDDKSKGAQVFWPMRHTVMVEQNIYFDKLATADCLEGEDYVTIETPAASKASLTSNSNPIAVAPETTVTSVNNDAPLPQ